MPSQDVGRDGDPQKPTEGMLPGISSRRAGSPGAPDSSTASLWGLINEPPEDFDPRAWRVACVVFAATYAAIIVVRFVAGQGTFVPLRLGICAYALFGVWLAPRYTWTRLRVYTIGVAVLLPLEAAFVDGMMGNHLPEVAVSALATFAALVFVQTGRDLVLVDAGLVVGHAVLLALLPDPAVPRATIAVVLAGALANGSIAATVSLVYRGRWSRSLAEFKASEARFRTLSATAPIGIFQTDVRGRFVYTNDRWAEIVGAPGPVDPGDGWSAVVHPDDRDALAQFLSDAAGGPIETAHEFRVRTPGGEVRWVHGRGKPVMVGGALAGHVGTLEDITERKRAEAVREEESSTAAALARIGRELISALETPKLLERLCALTCDVLACDVSTTWLWNANEGVYAPACAYGIPLRGDGTVASPIRPTNWRLLARLEQEDIVQVSATNHEYPIIVRALAEMGLSRVLCIALRKGDRIVGVQVGGYRERLEPFTTAQERIARGISQLASMALTNAQLVEELERASQLKSEFVSTMSHELRTPLNVILGYADMLREHLSAAEPAALLAQVRKASLELLDMIDATLNLSRIAAGKDEPRFERLALADLWDELESDFNALPAKAGVVIAWEPVAGVELCTDRRKLKIIVKNLVGNALKFTSTGTIRVECRAEGDRCVLTVRDTGIGIPREQLPAIFEMFRQVDSSDRRSYGGAGLGLYIVCRLLEQLGGEVAVDSEPGVGTTFLVTLPRQRRQMGARAAAA